jgi:uncharacterized protein (TIGR02996 family)
MPDAESFVAAIAAAPADDLPRLVFADWLDENGDPTRAAFIRDHVRLAKLRPGTDEYKTLFRKCADTLRANLPAWIQPACDAFGQPAEWKPGNLQKNSGLTVLLRQDRPLDRIEFFRGLVDRVELELAHVKDSAAVSQVFAHCPISRLGLVMSLTPRDPSHLLPKAPVSARRLTFYGVLTKEPVEAVLACPALANVTHLDGNGVHLEWLVRSPLAKRLKSLRILANSSSFVSLAEYPLDDRMELLKVTDYNGGSADEAWSALSRVSFRPTLKRLDLTHCGMTDDGLAAFARGEEWVRLQGLKLGGNLFGDRGWADFCRGWRTPELTYLDASRNRLTDAGAEMLARSGMLKTLRVIDLRGNRIAGRGAVALARAVAEGKLQRLLLAGNPLGKREAATVKGLLGERVDVA